MALPCPDCAQINRPGARFCDQCGLRFSEDHQVRAIPNRQIGLRHGTFVFCDLVQSTRLAARLDLDDLRTVYKSFQHAVATVSRRHGGHLIRFVGDGAFISFGYPEAREDAAESAVRTGLDLVRSLSSLDVVKGVSLELRVGISSGTVVMGDTIDESAVHEDSVYGQVPALAVRLLSVAPPGGVVIANETRKLAGRFFDYRDLGTLTLKDFDRVRAWMVTGESSIVSRFDARSETTHDTAIMGRDELLAQLLALVERSAQGTGSMLLLRGEAGLGKSRLARAMRDRAVEANATLFELDCSPRASNTPLQPLSSLLRRMANIGALQSSEGSTARLRELAMNTYGAERADDVLPYLFTVLGEPSAQAAPAESPEQALGKTIGMLSELLLAPAARQPVFILCEDVHWADATTLRLLYQLGGALASRPVLLVATSRTPVPEFAELKPPTIELGPLDDAAARRLVRAMASDAELPDATEDRILQRCEGNPLFLEEMARSVSERDSFHPGDNESAANQADIPMSLEALIQARVDRWPALKPVVQAASVLGREFSLPLLETVLRDRGDVREAVARLVDRDLLLRNDEAELISFRFKHALIHDAVYQTLLRSDRQQLHSKAAEALVQHFDGLPEAAPHVLAQHLAAARRYAEAIRCLLAAASDAAARGAYAESIGHCRTGLALVAHIDDVRERDSMELQLLTLLGVALAATQGYAQPEVQQTYERARSLCAGEDNADALFPVVRGLGTYYFVRGDLSQADEIAHQCFTLAERTQRIDHRIEALSFGGYPALYRGRLAEARDCAERCVALYRQENGERFAYPSAQDAGTAAWSLLSTATWLQGDPLASEQAVKDLLSHVEKLNRPFDSAYAHVWIASLRNLQRRYAEATFHAGVGIEIAERFGYGTWRTAAALQSSMAAAVPTGAAEWLSMLQEKHSEFIAGGAESSASFYLWGQARAFAQGGNTDASRLALASAMAHADKAGETYLMAELLLALAASGADDSQTAMQQLECALMTAEQQGAVATALRAACALLLHTSPMGLGSEDARAALAVLDGPPVPSTDAAWMNSTLKALKQALSLRFG